MIRHVGEWLDRKAKVNFRTYDVAANNYNTYTAEYLKMLRQSDDKI